MVGLWLIWRISQPLNPLRIALLVFTFCVVVLGVTAFGWFFEVAPLNMGMTLFTLVVSVVSVLIFEGLWRHARTNEDEGGLYHRLATRVEKRAHERASQRSL